VRDLVPYLIVFGCLIAVMGFFTWLKGLMRRRGLAGSALRDALASYEEAMRITSHESHIEIRAQAERQAPIASPDDPRWTSRTAARVRTLRTRSSLRPRTRRRRPRWQSR
jgi:hypothetical protein